MQLLQRLMTPMMNCNEIVVVKMNLATTISALTIGEKRMEPICLNILEAWTKYVDYNKNQTKFNLSTWDLTYHRSTEKLQHIINDYDESGLIAVSTIKQVFYDTTKKSSVKMYDLFTNPEGMKKHIEMYNLFQSKELIEAEDRYIDALDNLVHQIIGKKLIGKSNKDEFKDKVFGYTESVLNALDKCHTEFYKKSGNDIGNITKFTTKICVFKTLAECLITLDKNDDGMYLCYIDVDHSADGYFGFFIKSNGNLFSLNERVPEAFRGQHKNSRNARWTEGKADEIFPYEFVFSFDKFDYLGYSTQYDLNEDKLSFFELEEDAYLPLLIGMIFTAKKFAGKSTSEYEIYYTDSLLNVNIPRITADKNELMVLSNNELVIATNLIDLSIDYNKLMNGKIFDEFSNREICSNNNGQIFVDLYGQGFTPTSPLSMETYLTKSDADFVPEIVATKSKLRAAVVYDLRDQLSTYIKDKMLEEFNSFGGIKAVDKWYEEALKAKLDKIKELAVNTYVEVKTGKRRGDCSKNRCLSSGYDVNLVEKPRVSFYEGGCGYASVILNEHEGNGLMYDLDNGSACSMLFVFYFATYKDIEDFLECEVPKIMKGWENHRHGYSCNPLLNMNDRVEGIGTPFEYHPSMNKRYGNVFNGPYRTFSFAIGFSKRGFTALAKKLKIQIKDLKREDNAGIQSVEIEV